MKSWYEEYLENKNKRIKFTKEYLDKMCDDDLVSWIMNFEDGIYDDYKAYDVEHGLYHYAME